MKFKYLPLVALTTNFLSICLYTHSMDNQKTIHVFTSPFDMLPIVYSPPQEQRMSLRKNSPRSGTQASAKFSWLNWLLSCTNRDEEQLSPPSPRSAQADCDKINSNQLLSPPASYVAFLESTQKPSTPDPDEDYYLVPSTDLDKE